MFAKTGLSLIAAAGVAVGVVGMTMGGASGASVSCAPAHATADAHRSASSSNSNDSSSAGSRGSSANAGTSGTDASDPTDTSGVTDPAGTDGNGVALPADPSTIVAGATVPGADGTATDPSSTDTSGSDLPLLHLSENTNPTNAAGATVPHTGTDVVGRSTNISGLHIFGHVNQGR
jgi:hypothetical protein